VRLPRGDRALLPDDHLEQARELGALGRVSEHRDPPPRSLASHGSGRDAEHEVCLRVSLVVASATAAVEALVAALDVVRATPKKRSSSPRSRSCW